MALSRGPLRAWGPAALLLLAYTATAVLSLQFATVKGAGSALWLPAGVAVAGLMLGGTRLWPAILLGRLAAGLLTGSAQPFWAEFILAGGNTLVALLGVRLVHGPDGRPPVLHTLAGMLRFIVGAAMVPAVLVAAIGTLTLHFSSGLPLHVLPGAWLRWVFAYAAAVMVVAPLILTAREPLPPARRRHFILLLLAAAAASSLIFLSGEELPLRTWHVYPILVWAALAFSVRGAAAVLLILEVVAVMAVTLGRGPIAAIGSDPVWALVYLHQFLVLTSVTVLVLAAVADERRDKAALEQAQAALRELNEELERRVQERTQALRRSEEALLQARKMEAIGKLTGGIAHDFNNLLQTVSGSLELISCNPASPKLPRWVETARRATANGARLTGHLLAFSRMQKLELQPVAVAGLIQPMADLLRSTLGVSIRLELALEGARGLHVLSEPTQLEMMILNLAVNARDAMPEGGRLTIGAEAREVRGHAELADGCYVRIYVQDSGTGMTPEVASRAFDPFFTTKGVGQGTGLGLSMVYGLAKQSGGNANIVSAPGAGTTVCVMLPRVQAPPAPAEEAPAPEAAGARLRVLLVDDDADVRETTCAMLQLLGMMVSEAGSGEQALQQLDAARFDLVVLDYAMPEMNGAELLQRLRARGLELPVLMITGFADVRDLHARLGPQGALLFKPFGVAELGKAIAAMGLVTGP